jgi:hypothetical protein
LPFGFSYDGNPENRNSNIIMRIIDDDFLCFETKKRVPYQIIIETIE